MGTSSQGLTPQFNFRDSQDLKLIFTVKVTFHSFALDHISSLKVTHTV